MKTKILTLNPEVALNLFGTKGAHVGFAGNIAAWGDAVAWFDDPSEAPPKVKGLEFLVLTDKKQLFHATNMRNFLLLDEPHFAIGSGYSHALTALDSGLPPKEAIKLASKRDTSTGMGVKDYSF